MPSLHSASDVRRMTNRGILSYLAEQYAWIAKCGGDEDGYIANYGSRNDPDHSGDGGEAIYAADKAHLDALEAEAARRGLDVPAWYSQPQKPYVERIKHAQRDVYAAASKLNTHTEGPRSSELDLEPVREAIKELRRKLQTLHTLVG